MVCLIHANDILQICIKNFLIKEKRIIRVAFDKNTHKVHGCYHSLVLIECSDKANISHGNSFNFSAGELTFYP